MTARVWVLGDAVVDLLPEGQGRLLQCPGGAPANVAVGIARLKGQSSFIGCVGDDPFGHFMRRTLQNEQVDIRYLRCDPAHRTSTVVVALDEQGERLFTFMVRPSADLFLETADLPVFQTGEWLHACSIALSAEPSRTATYSAMTRMRAQGGFVSFDPNIREDLWPNKMLLRECLRQALPLADVVKLSEEERLFISGSEDVQHSMARLAQENGIRLLLVTQGKSGVLAWFNGEIHHYAARPVVSVDTTGAGDAFVAGLLWGLAEHGLPHDVTELAKHLRYAQLCGALATTAKGAMTVLPYLGQLQQSLS